MHKTTVQVNEVDSESLSASNIDFAAHDCYPYIKSGLLLLYVVILFLFRLRYPCLTVFGLRTRVEDMQDMVTYVWKEEGNKEGMNRFDRLKRVFSFFSSFVSKQLPTFTYQDQRPILWYTTKIWQKCLPLVVFTRLHLDVAQDYVDDHQLQRWHSKSENRSQSG